MSEQPKSKLVKVLNSESSKQEELEWLNGVVDAAGVNTYMSQLFSDELIGWTKGRVASDLFCNIVGELNRKDSAIRLQQATIKDQEKLLDERGAEIERLRAYAVSLRFRTETAEAHASESDGKIESLELELAELEDAAAECDSLKAQLEQVTEYKYKAQAEVVSYSQTIAALEQEVLELKAKLYDLTMAAGAA